MTQPIPVRVANFAPILDKLPPKVRRLADEYEGLFARLDTLTAELAEAEAPGTLELAILADRNAQAEAVRAGQPAATAGRPTQAELERRMDELRGEVDATIAAIHATRADLSAVCSEAFEDPKHSGRTAAAAAVDAYTEAIGSIETLRRDALAALALPKFLAMLGPHGGPPPGETLQLHPVQLAYPAMGFHVNASDPVPVPVFARVMADDAAALAGLVDHPMTKAAR